MTYGTWSERVARFCLGPPQTQRLGLSINGNDLGKTTLDLTDQSVHPGGSRSPRPPATRANRLW
ncbi:hypothetical protein XM38_031710 [Halomicronema hongdechloris C2206]|uniref:Uncharacterized protein n=1 Tax=Halomicronema hongdechloris C2206 TaxID=1641165 RepID=A0A1Z3HPN5_9CYAN|nr:hypothetical protein XM38_031710 [Halomicronema hongdechloris C2206]